MRFASLRDCRLGLALATLALTSGCALSPPSPAAKPSSSPGAPSASGTRSPDSSVAVSVLGKPGSNAGPSETQAQPSSSTPPPKLPSLGAQAVTHALGVIGSPYRYGGVSPSGFDCSGLVRYSFHLAGLSLPRATGEQREVTRRLAPSESLEAGDLVFFSRGRSALHVGIFAGDGRFVHAATRGGGVRLEPLAAPHWRQRFLEARRVEPTEIREYNR